MEAFKQNQDQLQVETRTLVIKTLVSGATIITAGAVATTAGSASIPIGIGAIAIGESVKYIADAYDSRSLEYVGDFLSDLGIIMTFSGITGRWKASKQ